MRRLARDRGERHVRRSFVVEGPGLVAEALDAGHAAAVPAAWPPAADPAAAEAPPPPPLYAIRPEARGCRYR